MTDSPTLPAVAERPDEYATLRRRLAAGAVDADLAPELRSLLRAYEGMRAANLTMETALTHYASSLSWMAHKDDPHLLRKVWVQSNDGRDYARKALGWVGTEDHNPGQSRAARASAPDRAPGDANG